ncbi:MAG: SIMPL domain-containing protein [Erythrobacter sp.]|uniref:SIMPL domain-containing protein n=1 Tax=Erythrobacter sp. TaxID=1042 RepID=UPI003A844A0D
MIRQSLALIAATAVATLVLVPSVAQAQQVEIEANGPVIDLSVYESVTAEPDVATVGAGVSTQARTAVEAMRLNAVEMSRVIDQIRALGVDEKDIQTTGINLSAMYDYDRDTQQQVFRGYQVSNRVSVKLRDISRTGAALDALVEAGATDLSGPSFSIEDDEAAKDLARQRAVERAHQRARAYAAIFGYDDVRVLSVSEAMQGRGPMPEMAMRAAADAIMVQGTPIQPGLAETGVSISIKYEMISSNSGN